MPDTEETYWGHWSLVSAMVSCLRTVLQAQSDVEWCMLLSGQDYPIRPLNELQIELSRTDIDAFVAGGAVAGSNEEDECRLRYDYRWRRVTSVFPLGFIPRRLLDRLNGAQSLVVVRTRARNEQWVGLRRHVAPTATIAVHKGSTWITVNRRVAERIVRAYDHHELGWFAQTLCSDEAWIPTLLNNDPSIRVAPYGHHFIRFEGGAASPNILDLNDLPDLISSGMFFARKFNESPPSKLFEELNRRCGLSLTTNGVA